MKKSPRTLSLNTELFTRFQALCQHRQKSASEEIDRLIAKELELPEPKTVHGRPPRPPPKYTKHEQAILNVMNPPLKREDFPTEQAWVDQIRAEATSEDDIRINTGLWPHQIKAALRALQLRCVVAPLEPELGERVGDRRPIIYRWFRMA